MPNPFTQVSEAIVFMTLGMAFATPFLLANVRIAPLVGLIDWPKARGMSEEQIPIVGPGIVIVFVLAIILMALTFGEISSWFFLTSLLIAIMGFFDDRAPLSAVEKLFWQLLCAVTIVFFDPSIYENVTSAHGTAGTLLALFFILGLVNALNFIDGIDGLAGSMAVIGGLGALFFSAGPKLHFSFFALSAVLVGALVPFLVLNFKRKGFLGNTGSYFLGFTLAYLHLATPIQADQIFSRLALSGLCFIVPIADSIVVIASRTLTVRSPFMADKGHLHHRMVQTSIPLRYVLMNFGLIGLGGLVIAVIMHFSGAVRDSIVPVFVCLSQLGITGILILLMEKASKRRVQSYIERLDHGDPIYYLKFKLASKDGTKITKSTLHRLEALISAEIRVSDICFTREPDQLCVVLRTYEEPMKWVTSRFSPVFEQESLDVTTVVDQGEFVKVQHNKGKKKLAKASASVVPLRKAT